MSQILIDVSVPVYSGMVHWPGDPEVKITRKLDMAKGAVCNMFHELICLPLALRGAEGAPARVVLRTVER